MDNLTEKHFPSISQTLVKPKIKRKKANENVTKELFKKLRSWKEDSDSTLFNILSSYCNNIDSGVGDMAEKISGLQTELSEVKQEKTILLETVNYLHGEIRDLKGRLQESTGQYNNSNIEEVGKYDDEQKSTIGYDTQSTENYPGHHNQEGITKHEQLPEDILSQERDNDLRNESGFTDVGVDYIEADPFESGMTKDEADSLDQNQAKEIKRVNGKYSCPLCKYDSQYHQGLTYHMATIHNKGEMFACEKCPYKSASVANVRNHREAIHEKKKRFKCGECDYSTYWKCDLKKHERKHRRS